MKCFRIATLVVLHSATGLGGVAVAAPSIIPVHADLRHDGLPANGAVQIGIFLYEDASNFTPMFEEEQTVDVVDGWLTFDVGAARPLDLEKIPSDGALWLGLTVDGEPMLPRIRFGAVPYAYRAQHAVVADRVVGLDVDDIAKRHHTHLFRELEGVPEALLDGDDVRSDADLMNFARRACYNTPDELYTALDDRYFGSVDDPYPLLARSGRLNGDADDDLLTRFAADGRYLRTASPVPGDLVVTGEIRRATARSEDQFHPAIAFSTAAAAGTELGHDSSAVFFTEDSLATNVMLASVLDVPVGAKLEDLLCYLVDDESRGTASVRAVVHARHLLDPDGTAVAQLEATTSAEDATPDMRDYAASASHVVVHSTVYTLLVEFETDVRSDRLRFYGCKVGIETDAFY